MGMWMLIALAVSIIFIVIGSNLTMKTGFSANLASSILLFLGGIGVGALTIPGSVADFIHGTDARSPNVSEVKWVGDQITLPTPTDIGALWFVSTAGEKDNGSIATGNVFIVPRGTSPDNVYAYIKYADGRSTHAAKLTPPASSSPTTPTPTASTPVPTGTGAGS